MIATIYLLLGLAMLGLVAWLWPRRQHMHTPARGAVVACVVALLLASASVLMIALARWGLTNDGMLHAQRMLGLAAQHMSVPLLGLACLFLAKGLHWAPSLWGKIILGLMGFYQLLRYMELSEGYLWLVNLVGAGALLAAALLYIGRDKRITVLCLVAPIGLLAPAVLTDSWPLAGLFTASQQASWLIPGFVAAGLAVGLLSEQAHNSVSNGPAVNSTTPS